MNYIEHNISTSKGRKKNDHKFDKCFSLLSYCKKEEAKTNMENLLRQKMLEIFYNHEGLIEW